MKAQLPRPEHFSYLLHRKQLAMRIILPVALSAVLMIIMIILISLSTFKSGGDVARWAAISTIWIIIPILIGGLIFLALLIALIYGMARLLNMLPHYTSIAQDYVYVARSYIVRGADAVSNSIISIDGFIATIKTFFQRSIQ
jgi:hypothetical protein